MSRQSSRTVIFTTLRFALLTLLSAMLGACNGANHHADHAIAKAETLMEQKPDSALALLQSIDPSAISGDRRRALHALLLSQARHKNWIDEESDTLILQAVNYFSTVDEPHYAMLANYYEGHIQANIKEYANSSFYLLRALEYAKLSENPFWQARIYDDLADNARATHQPHAAIRYKQKAIPIFKTYDNKTNFLNHAYIGLAENYNSVNNPDSAIISLHSIDTTNVNSTLLYLYHNTLADSYLLKDKADSAKQHFFKGMTERETNEWLSSHYTQLALIYNHLHNIDSAIFCIRKAQTMAKNPSESHYAASNALSIFIDNDMIEEAVSASAQCDSLNLYINEWSDNQQIPVAESTYNLEKYYTELSKTEKLQLIALIAFIIISIVIIAFILYIRESSKRKAAERLAFEAKRNLLISELKMLHYNNNQLKTTLTNTLAQNASMQSSQTKLLKSQFTYLNALCKKYYSFRIEKSVTPSHRQNYDFSNDLEKILAAITDSKDSINNLEEMINQSRDNLMSKFKQEFPKLSSNEHLLATLIFAGLSSHSICLITNTPKIETYRNRKSRLKRIIENSDTIYKHEFLDAISNPL